MQCNTFGAAAGTKAAAAQNVTMGKLLSHGTGGEKCVLYIGWACAALTGLVLPMFIFFIGPVFDAFAPGEEADDSFDSVMTFVGIMGGLACFVFLTSYLQHNFLTKGSILIVRRIKKAYLESILKQESSWFDLINHTELASRVSEECSTIEKGIGQKYGQLLHSYCMVFAGLVLAFVKGWSLALPMLLLCPLLFFGISCLIKGATGKYVKSAAAFAKCASFCDEALSAIRIVVAFGME